VPWRYVRARLAAHWGVPPWEVDAAPVDEVMEALTLMQIEAEARTT